jgi:hypothetical protein
MPAVRFFARLDLDRIFEGTNWCPSISGWALTIVHEDVTFFINPYEAVTVRAARHAEK